MTALLNNAAFLLALAVPVSAFFRWYVWPFHRRRRRQRPARSREAGRTTAT